MKKSNLFYLLTLIILWSTACNSNKTVFEVEPKGIFDDFKTDIKLADYNNKLKKQIVTVKGKIQIGYKLNGDPYIDINDGYDKEFNRGITCYFNGEEKNKLINLNLHSEQIHTVKGRYAGNHSSLSSVTLYLADCSLED